MASSKLFGGTNMGDIARSIKGQGEPSPYESAGSARPVVPAAELALTGATSPQLARETILMVDPKRCRGWKYHNRAASWFTKENCEDIISSISKNGQKQPAVVRKLPAGEEGFDYEVIYGMRRRFACEVLNSRFRVVVVNIGDTDAAILMHLENADRKDITAMERALSFQEQIEEKLFSTQEALAAAIGMSPGQITKALKAAALMKQGTINALFPDVTQVPVELAYKLSSLMDRPGAKDVVLQAAKNLQRKESGLEPGAILKTLISSLDRTRKLAPMKKEYNLGAANRVSVTRNAGGKVTLAFSKGVKGVSREEISKVVEQIVADFGEAGDPAVSTRN